MPDHNMRGVFPILAMPFDPNGAILVEDLQREVEWMVEGGLPGVGIALGSEVYKLTEADRDLALRTVVDQAAGRLKVVMNTGVEGTHATVEYSRRAQELGADALMIRPPSFAPLSGDDAAAYFVTVAGSVGIPIFMQDVLGAPVPPPLAVRLAGEHENLCYIKVESAPTVPRFVDLAGLLEDAGVTLTLFGGAGGQFLLEEARRGSDGSMPWAVIADVYNRVWNRFKAGDEHGAEAEYRRYAALGRTIAQGMGIAMWTNDHILKRRGIFSAGAQPRPPAPRPDAIAIRELDALLEELDLATAPA